MLACERLKKTRQSTALAVKKKKPDLEKAKADFYFIE